MRHSVDLTMRTFDLVMDGSPGSWTANGDRLTLHPFPNRSTSYRFGVVNLGPQAKKIRVKFLIPHAPVNLNALTTSTTADFPAASDEVTVDVPAGERRFVGAELEPEVKTSVDADAAAGVTEDEAAAAGEPEPPPGPAVDYGLIAEISDEQDARQTFFKQIRVVPQRPRRYVQPRVGYNARLERIEVSVTARDDALLPADPVEVVCEVAGELAAGTQGKLRDTLHATKPQANLFVNVPATPSQQVTLYLHVDDYPRAFVYRVPTGGQSVDIPELTDLTEVRLIQPETIAGFQAPSAITPIQIQVDAPVGSFEDGGDYVGVQIDENRDGQLDANTVRFQVDRQAAVFLEDLSAGTLSLNTRVRDFGVPLATQRLQNVDVEVLGQFGVEDITYAVDPLTLRIDGAPPRIHRVSLTPASGAIVTGSELQVSVWVRDAMSGVKRVELAFDTDGTEQLTPETPLTKAFFDPLLKRWVASLATAEMLGMKTLLVQATDRVDNTSQAFKVPVLIITPEQVAATLEARPKVLQGTVSFKDRSLAGVQVTLLDPDGQEIATATTDGEGGYVFQSVTPGTYSLLARGVINNVPRRGLKELMIEAESGNVVHADIVLK